MILIELNEFNPELLRNVAQQFGLKNLQRLSDFQYTETQAVEQEERFGLDPWVQWPSIHTGKPAAEHGLYHLADAHKLAIPQVWDKLSANGISSGIWGAMNAKLNRQSNVQFYFPDPWTYTESASDSNLNRLLALPRYYAQHYLDLRVGRVLTTTLKTASFFLHPAVFIRTLSQTPFILRKAFTNHIDNALLFSVFDLVNAIAFRHYCKRNPADFKLVFLNSVAHCQHHCWTDKDGVSKEMQTMFEFLDRSIGLILDLADDAEPVLVANAFSQYCSIDNNEFLYRQTDPDSFFRSLGLDAVCEQLMTNDSQLIFASREQAVAAAELLRGFRVLGKDLFQVDIDSHDNTRLFCQVLVWDDIPPGEEFYNATQRLKFYDYFEKVVRRSGSHEARGVVLSKGIQLPAKMFNYELHDHILNNYGVTQ